MMDAIPLFDEARHPVKPSMKLDFSGPVKKPRSRTLRPVRYYYIDFGHARRYDPKDGPPREFVGIGDGYGGDGTVPEFQTTNEFCDPFPVDVYRVGNLIREFFTEVSCVFCNSKAYLCSILYRIREMNMGIGSNVGLIS